MSARSGCCFTNLMKLDPITGAIIWKKYIPGAGTQAQANINWVYPLRGTNDVIVNVSEGGFFGGARSVSRVDSNGNQVWNYFRQSYYDQYCPTASQADGASIVSYTIQATVGAAYIGLLGLDYNGNIIWRQDPPLIWYGGVYVTPAQFQVYPGNVVLATGYTAAYPPPYYNLSSPYKTVTLKPSTGAVLSQNSTAFDYGYPLAVNQSNGNFFSAGNQTGPGGTADLLTRNPSYGTVVTGSAYVYSPTTSYWGAQGISTVLRQYPTFAPNLSLINPSTNAFIYSVSSLGGATLSQAAYATWNDATGSYFATINTGNPTAYNVWKLGSYGGLLWAQNCAFASNTGRCQAIAVADSGYVYAGGGV